MKISELVRSEIQFYLTECNFTTDEKDLFLLKTKDISYEECAEILNISIATVYRIRKRICRKMEAVNESDLAKGRIQDIQV